MPILWYVAAEGAAEPEVEVVEGEGGRGIKDDDAEVGGGTGLAGASVDNLLTTVCRELMPRALRECVLGIRSRNGNLLETVKGQAKQMSYSALTDPSVEALTNAEVAELLGGIKNDLEANDKEVSENLKQTLVYCEQMANQVDHNKVLEVKRTLQELEAPGGKRLHTFEIAQLINLGPYEDSENALLLIPTLARFSEDTLAEAVSEVQKLQDA